MIFLKLEQRPDKVIGGDATADGYEGQIVLDSMRWELEASHRDASGNIRTNLEPKALRFNKFFDSSSSVIYQRIASTTAKDAPMFERATISVTDATMGSSDAERYPMMRMVLNNCRIDSVMTSASESGKAVKLGETFVITFETGSLEISPRNRQNVRQAVRTFQIPAKVK